MQYLRHHRFYVSGFYDKETKVKVSFILVHIFPLPTAYYYVPRERKELQGKEVSVLDMNFFSERTKHLWTKYFIFILINPFSTEHFPKVNMNVECYCMILNNFCPLTICTDFSSSCGTVNGVNKFCPSGHAPALKRKYEYQTQLHNLLLQRQ